jgi:hypothetical protein
MKSKMVEYRDMFNPSQKITAKNKLVQSWYQRSRDNIREYVSVNTREAAQHKKCRCHHPNFISDVCTYRNCNHDIYHHHN